MFVLQTSLPTPNSRHAPLYELHVDFNLFFVKKIFAKQDHLGAGWKKTVMQWQ